MKETIDKAFGSASPSSTSFAVGDLNFPDETEGRYHPRSGQWTYAHKSIAKWFGN